MAGSVIFMRTDYDQMVIIRQGKNVLQKNFRYGKMQSHADGVTGNALTVYVQSPGSVRPLVKAQDQLNS